ncbi:MAG TPA: hypothetical protein PLF81_12715 [Candidatus Anammoximicrobium sp.]|nr:hypothetical protein [Candidatus Anammoximicrobium sp.]
MAVKDIERNSGEFLTDDVDLFGADDHDDGQPELEDETGAVWPSDDVFDEALPPAPGRSRRVSHDW